MTSAGFALATLAWVIALSILLAWLVVRLAPRDRRKRRLGVAVALTVACLPGAWFVVFYLHKLPEPPWFYEFRSKPFAEGWLSLFLPTAVAWAAFLPGPPARITCALGFLAMLPPFMKPLLLRSTQIHPPGGLWEGEACLQTYESTCGPASAATVLRFLGDTRAEETDIARRAWSSGSGTEAWHLARVLRKRGRQVEFQSGGLPPANKLPGILGVKLGRIGHFIAVLENHGDQWTIADPLVGKETVSRQELERRYQITPFFMRVY